MTTDKKTLFFLNFNEQEKEVTEFLCGKKHSYRMANSNYNPLSNVTNATTIFTDDYNATHDDKEYQMKAEVLESDPKQIYFEEMANIMV